MTQKQRRTKLKAGLILALAAVFLIALLAFSFSPGTDDVALAATEFGKRSSYEQVGPGAASGFVGLDSTSMEAFKPSDGIVTTSNHLLYVFFSPNATGSYTLGNNFRIADYTWAIRGATLRGNLDGAGFEIWNASSYSEENYTGTSDYVGGLFAEIKSGKTLKNLYYYFSGGIYGKKSKSASYLAVGGMIGVNNGTVTNCYVDIGGSIDTEGKAEGVTSYVGGLVGFMNGGNVKSSDIIVSASISAYNDKVSNSSSKHSIVYAGGVVGRIDGGSLTLCKIKSSAGVMSADNTKKWENTVGEIIGGITGGAIDTSTEYNDKEHIHPAGGVIGGIGDKGKVTYNEVEVTGSAMSYGTGGASNGGSIAGGFIGELADTCTTNATVQSNAVKIKCSLSAFMIESFSVVGTVTSWFSDRSEKMTIYVGGAVGKCDAGSITFKNNYFAIQTDDSLIEDNYGDKSDLGYSCKVGLLCGNADLVGKLGNNNWLSRKLSESDTGFIAGNANSSSGNLHHLVIFGDGEVGVQGGKITQAEAITLEEKPICSPFYAWMTADAMTTGDVGKDYKKKNITLNNGTGDLLFAVFIDTKIESSGELTQLAKDINQIDLRVYKKIGTSDTKDDDGNLLMSFSGVTPPTLSWLNVDLEKDILVQSGTPVIEDFYGTFDGKGHTISFAAGSKITHNFKKDEDHDKGRSETFEADDKQEDDICSYDEYTTGLFGVIHEGAVIKDLNIIFGGTIDASGGLDYSVIKEAGDKMKAKKIHDAKKDTYKKPVAEGGDANSVYNNTYAMANFAFPENSEGYTKFNEVFFYALTGNGYVASRGYNPGYIEVVPHRVDCIVNEYYVGILAGMNYGTVTNVDVEATKSAFVTVAGKHAYFGGLCGMNAGALNDISVTINGKVTVRSRNLSVAGGMIGISRAPANSAFTGLNAYVGGEIKLEKALNYHAVTVRKYTDAHLLDGSSIPKDGDDENTVTDGYSGIAVDTTDDDDWEDGLDEALCLFEATGLMETASYRMYGNDSVVVTECIGTLIGFYQANAATFSNVAAVSGAKGTFNTTIYNTDAGDAYSYVGAVVGLIQNGVNLPTFRNTWAVMSYEEFAKESLADRRRPIASKDYTESTGVNCVYVQKTVAVANIDLSSSLPVSFTVAAQEGMVFSGWYDYTSGERSVITTGLVENVFTPQNQTFSNRIYTAELLNLQFFSEEELKKLSASTNEGRGYDGVTFTLGTSIEVNDFIPIGTLTGGHSFRGTLDGNGLTVTIASNVSSGDYAGLFGCIGATGSIKNLTVRVVGDIGNENTLYTGAVAAVNYGTIGQDTSTGKVVAKIEGSMKGRHVGGIAGVNYRIVKNAEVYFVYESEYNYGKIEAVAATEMRVYAGGAIGFNKYANEATIAKNLIVYYDNTAANTPINSTMDEYALGGVIGENGNGTAAYSLVAVFNYATIFGEYYGSNGAESLHRGLIIGYNDAENTVDSLWALSLSHKLPDPKSTEAISEYDAELGAPLEVYQGTEEAPTTGLAVLMNGKEARSANILIKYGYGDVSVRINGAQSAKGGQITFLSTKLSRPDANGIETVPEEKRVSFYDYVASFEHGTRVPVSEGNTGFTFSPTVGTDSAAGLRGKVYYAGFCNTTIATQADYIAVAENVAQDYRLYVEYNITNNFTIDETVTLSIGSEETPFIGAINGNAYTVTMSSTSSLLPFVGVLGREGDERRSSLIKNLYLDVRSGSGSVTSRDEESGSVKARGYLTDVNHGTIYGVNIALHGYLKTEGVAGAVAGKNYGKIDSAAVAIEYAKAFGRNGFGAISGSNVGGVVGENYGEIGNSMPNSIEVTITREGGYAGVLYATNAVGAVAGVNGEGGVIRSAFVSLSGTIAGKYASALVGDNSGHIESAFVTIDRKAIYAGSDAFGTIAGVNSGIIGYEEIDYDTYERSVKAFIYAAPYTFTEDTDMVLVNTSGEKEERTTICTIPAMTTSVIGGVVGINEEEGVMNALIVETHDSLVATSKAGGLAGENLGSIGIATLTTAIGCDIVADKAGGVAGRNAGTIDRVVATLRGGIGDASGSYAGGIIGQDVKVGGSVTNSAIALYDDVYGDKVGLGAAQAVVSSATNTWVQICNSSLTPVVGNDLGVSLDAGYNVIRVLNETLLSVSLKEKSGRLTFESAISGVKKWYTDISAWTSTSGFESSLTGKRKYEPDGLETNRTYFVCYDDLEITGYSAFNALATKINSNSYYNNVLFRLDGDIAVDAGSVLRPIGTEEHPFNGIFDGALYSITMQKDSAISGQEYSGLFGYTEKNAVIKNFIFSVEQGAAIGSVNSYEIGSLVGYNQGAIKNVFVNLSVNLTYNSKKRSAGELIGTQAAGAPEAENVWISVLNGRDPVVGNMTDTSFGVNQLGVLGNGLMEVAFYVESGKLSDLRKQYLLGADVDIIAMYNTVKGFKSFGGWYNDITNENSLIKVSEISGVGKFAGNKDEEEIWLITDVTAFNANVTLSFISLEIRDEADFAEFAENIKNYGDQGAVFKLTADIVVEYPNCLAVGTPDRPFTGTFDGQGHSITVKGRAIKREYAGIFGYVGTNGTIKNLLIDTDENVRFGDNDALYSGVAVALLYGNLKNVVVRVHADTVVYTTQGAPSSGGVVGRAGKLDEAGNVVYGYLIDNCWLIVEENATVTEPMGRQEGQVYDDFYASNGVARKIRMVGSVAVEDNPFETNPFKKGLLQVSIKENGILFDTTDAGTGFYGFIDNTTSDESEMKPISDTPSNPNKWTVREGNLYGSGENASVASVDMLCVFINKHISTVDDFLMISENVRLGRNYRGIRYELGADLDISADLLVNGVYEPIGGEVRVRSGSGFESYIERNFIGGFDGRGHTITLAEDVVIDARYAGLFGRVGAEARISNLIVVAQCAIGKDSEDNTKRTIYAGVLAAYALGGSYSNVALVLDKNATLFGSLGTGRAFGYLPADLASDVAENSWVISYNSKSNYELNESELSYNNGGEGINQGGFNSLMVIAAGILDVDYNTDNGKFAFTYSDPNPDPNSQTQIAPYWTDRYRGDESEDYFHFREDSTHSNDMHGTWSASFRNNGYYPDGTERRAIYNVSFLNSRIESFNDLKKYAENVNAGYDFYKLTFTLENDINIGDGFVAIGTAASGMNGTFDGKKHTITLPAGKSIEGEYAGIFGYVSEDGEIANLRIVIAGSVGKNDYTTEDIENYKVKNTLYAGAIAYNNGVLKNVVVVSDGAKLNVLNNEDIVGVKGLAIAYDATNLLENVWALVDASSYVDAIGVSAVGDTRVNTMTIVGIGEVDAAFAESSYEVKFTTDGVVPVMGWYKSFEKNQQISKAMLSSGDLKNGLNGYLLAPADYIGVKYEVAVIKTVITSVEELMAVAEDVNVGGYSFENITFTLGADILILPTSSIMPIGNEEHRFKGTFSGAAGESYHTISISPECVIDGIFGNNAGVVTDLGVIVYGTVGRATGTLDNIYGAIARINAGTIKRSYVDVRSGAVITGYTVGGIVGENRGTVSDCLAFIREGGTVIAETTRRNVVNAGAIAGVNYGTIEGATDFTYWSSLLPVGDIRIAKEAYGAEANVFIYGTVAAVSHAAAGSSAYTNAGGAVGNNNEGNINYLIVYLTDSGVVRSEAKDAGMTRAGALVGYSKAGLNHNAIFLYGEIVSKDYLGGTAGYLDGVIALNVWQVTLNRNVEGAGEGAKTVNCLNIKGNGKIKAAIDLFTKRIIFTNVTENRGTDLDGWYTATSVEVDEKTGNIGENRNTFLPLATIQNKHVMVIFVNTEIYSVADLSDMAASVSGGLSGSTIVFTLMNDITIKAGDLAALIGTEEYPFNNVFDGNHKTITLEDGALVGEYYTALFGYTGSTGVIRDLNVVVKAGNYGSAISEKSAILVAVNYGTITDVTIDVEEGATLVGQTVGSFAAASYRTIENVTLNLSGALTTVSPAVSEPAAAEGESINTAIAGGLVGANDGVIRNVSVTVGETAYVGAVNAATAYAGMLVGENYKTISAITIVNMGTLEADGRMIAYSGTLAGINLGNVYRIYVEIAGATYEGNARSGGLVGNNVNALSTSFVKIMGEDFVGSDSAVGYAKQKDDDKVYNVWIYSDRAANVSDADHVNSMITDRVISCPTAAEVTAGKIAFTAEITDLTDQVAFFANILASGFSPAGSGAAMDNVVYSTEDAKSYVTYLTYDIVEEQAVSREIKGVRVRLLSRSEMGSGSELYAFAQAVNSGVYSLANAEFTLTADFTLPERAFPSIHLPTGVILNGDHHVVTVGNATLTDGLFSENNGTIEKIGYRLTKAETGASLVKVNNGGISNAAVYLEEGASLVGGKYFVLTENGTTENLWIVTRENVESSYPQIKINGVGTLTQGGEALTFTANAGGDIIFIGYTEDHEIFSSASLFDTAGKAGYYTAEFISKTLDSDKKLQVLSDITDLGYTGENEVFTIAANLTAKDTLFKTTTFRGTLLGGGYTLKAQGVSEALFGAFGGVLESLVIDLTENDDITLFGSDDALTMRDVVILEDGENCALGGTVTASGLWIVTNNKALYSTLSSAEGSYSVLYKNGVVGYAFDQGVKVTASDSESQVFAGWYADLGEEIGAAKRTSTTLALPTTAGNAYYLNYINRTFTCTDDLVRLSKAVKSGFEFAGVTFYVQDNGFTVTERVETIGDATHEFKGNIFGGSKSAIRYANYGGEPTFVVEPFLYRVNGEIRELIFEYDAGATFVGTPTLVVENNGLMQGVAVISKGVNTFAGGAGLTLANNGVIKNGWLLTRGSDVAVKAGDLVGVNEMRMDETIVDVSFSDSESAQGTRVIFHISADAGKFIAIYDHTGKVVFPGNYSSGIYTSPATATGVRIAVKSIDTIYDQDELVYLGYATSAGNLAENSVITVGADIEIKRNLVPIKLTGITVDLAGHYLDLTTSAATSDVIFSATAGGSVRNGAVYLHKGCYVIGGEGLALDNVVLFLSDNAMTLPAYTIGGKGAVIVTEDSTRKSEIVTLSGSYNYLYAPRAAYVFDESPEADAAILANFDKDDDYKIGFVGKENAYYYYGGRDDLSETEQVAYLAAKEIDSAEKFIDFIKAAMLAEEDGDKTLLKGAEITLTADITLDGTEEIVVEGDTLCGLTFAGTLYGGGHTVTVVGGTISDSYLTIAAGGSATRLALAFRGATIGTESLISVDDDAAVSALVLVVYQAGSAKQEDSNALVVNVYGEGTIEVTFGEAISFTARENGNYALRDWKDDEGNSLIDGLADKYTITPDSAISAEFALRYLISVEYVGVDDAVLKSNARDLPTFDGVGVTFVSDVTDGKISVKVNDIGRNFLLTGVTPVGATIAENPDAHNYKLSVSATYDITLRVSIEYIEMVWETKDYRAGATEYTAYDELEEALTLRGYSVDYKYYPLEDTPDTVNGKPYHAGIYRVEFNVSTGGLPICAALGGLKIRPAILTFKSVTILDKTYDGTADATAKTKGDGSLDISLEGFVEGSTDANYISAEGLMFTFADANAEQGKVVYVSGEGSLSYNAPTTELTPAQAVIYPYLYRNYVFDSGSIASNGVIIRANINRRTLELTLNSKTVEYLDQFGESAPVLKPEPVNPADLMACDKDAFDASATQLVTREKADCYDVGYYRIIVGDSFSFPNYEVRLQSGLEAYYIVTPSKLTLEFATDDTMTYGDAAHTPKYLAYDKGSNLVERCAYDGETPLIFTEVVYNDGKALLPNTATTKYSFTCLFSAENKNYTVDPGANGYRIVNGKTLAVVKGEETLLVTKKDLLVTADAASNTKRFGVRTDKPTASLAYGVSFVETGAKLVVSRAQGEAVGSYALQYGVVDATGANITSRYTFSTRTGDPYYFTITPVAIRVKPVKTQVNYGTRIDTINYGASVEGGGISLADVYWATNWKPTNAPEKANATLADLGITIGLEGSLKGVLPVGEYTAKFDVTNDNENITDVHTSNAQNMIVVRKRDLKIKVKDLSKTYDGAEVGSSAFTYEFDSNASYNIIEADKKKVRIVENGYTVIGGKASVGIYKVEGSFSLVDTTSEQIAKNYNIISEDGDLKIIAVAATVKAEIGYFDQEGAFTPAVITRNGFDYLDKYYYGDSTVRFRYTIKGAKGADFSFFTLPEDGTDQEISDYIATKLKISHYRLNGLVAGIYGIDNKGNNNFGMAAANNNYSVTFTSNGFEVEPVSFSIKLLSGTKTVGEPDPEPKYEVVAMDVNDDNQVIENYSDLSQGTFEFVVIAERSEGETLGTYTYANVLVEIKNLAAGVFLTDDRTETGAQFADRIEIVTDEATLSIEAEDFTKTASGKAMTYILPIVVFALIVLFLIVGIPLIKRRRRAKKAAEMNANGQSGGTDDDFDAADFDIDTHGDDRH